MMFQSGSQGVSRSRPWLGLTISLALGILALSSAHSATVQYTLDRSQTSERGNYVDVTLSEGLDGAIEFLVEVLPELSDQAGNNFGIQKFAFNVAPGIAADASTITGLPDGWEAEAKDGGRMSEFGFFDIRLAGRGNNRLDSLSFAIEGVEGDTFRDYVLLSSGQVPEVHGLFAAQVAGTEGATGTYFTVVPLPAAAWLLGSALMLLPLLRSGSGVV